MSLQDQQINLERKGGEEERERKKGRREERERREVESYCVVQPSHKLKEILLPQPAVLGSQS